MRGKPRTFGSFAEAGAEPAISQLYGGIHYPFGNENGLRQRACIGTVIIKRVQCKRWDIVEKVGGGGPLAPEFFQQGFGFLEVDSVKPFAEPVVDLTQQLPGSLGLALTLA